MQRCLLLNWIGTGLCLSSHQSCSHESVKWHYMWYRWLVPRLTVCTVHNCSFALKQLCITHFELNWNSRGVLGLVFVLIPIQLKSCLTRLLSESHMNSCSPRTYVAVCAIVPTMIHVLHSCYTWLILAPAFKQDWYVIGHNVATRKEHMAIDASSHLLFRAN